jgi:hypothetical protein
MSKEARRARWNRSAKPAVGTTGTSETQTMPRQELKPCDLSVGGLCVSCQGLTLPGASLGTAGHTELWPSSWALAAFLDGWVADGEPSAPAAAGTAGAAGAPLRVLELGAGCGAVGIWLGRGRGSGCGCASRTCRRPCRSWSSTQPGTCRATWQMAVSRLPLALLMRAAKRMLLPLGRRPEMSKCAACAGATTVTSRL